MGENSKKGRKHSAPVQVAPPPIQVSPGAPPPTTEREKHEETVKHIETLIS